VNVLYFGLPLGACLLAADGHRIVQAVMGRPEGTGLRRLRRVLGPERVTMLGSLGTSKTPKNLESLVHPGPIDLVVSWFFPKKLPPAILQLGRRGTVGVHPSLLPRHRGPDPYFAAIDQGDPVTGVTAHRLEADYDTGAMLDRESLPIDPSWDAWTLARKLDRPSLRVLRRVVRALADGTAIEERQDEAHATQAPEPGPDLLELDVKSMTPESALRRIRAAAPWPGAYFFTGEECLVVERASAVAAAPFLEAGELAALPDGRVLLGLAQGALHVERVRDEEDDVLAGEALHRWAEARLSLA